MSSDYHSPSYNFLSLILVALALFFGIAQYEWYFILVLGAINMVSYVFFESTVTESIIKERGMFWFIVAYLPNQTLMGSMPSAIVYIIGYFISTIM